MRRVVASFVFLILWMTLGCAGGQDTASQQPSSSSDQNDKGSQAEESSFSDQNKSTQPVDEKQPTVINLSGNGQTATDPFGLESGLAIFRMTYEGERNFIVHLLDGTGSQTGGALLANEIGSFKGSKAEQTKAGQYVLDVQASGPWTITIEQPRPASSVPENAHFTYDTSKTATDFFRLPKGLKRFYMTHQGQRNFIVHLLDKNGGRVNGGLLANETGPFEGSKAIQIPRDDIYLLQVEASGLWRVEIEGYVLGGK